MRKEKQERILELFEVGKYCADHGGSVYSRSNRKRGLTENWRQLSMRRANTGYRKTTLFGLDGRPIYASTHQLVFLFFRGKFNQTLEINHVNGVKTDNRLDNLEVVTRSENHKHAHRLGLMNQRHERNGAAKLSKAEARKIKVMLARGDSPKKISRDFGVSYVSVWRIGRGITWAGV
jgi:hypothetical protein